MKTIVIPHGQFGPFQSVEANEDHYLADGLALPYGVLGQNLVVDAENLPQPWIPGAYTIDEGAIVLDEGSPAWQEHLQAEADRLVRMPPPSRSQASISNAMRSAQSISSVPRSASR
jgi:hypothetical protein